VPPVDAYFDGKLYHVGDGYHRSEGARLAGKAGVRAKVRRGTERDAFLASLGANETHGFRRTNADKRRVVEMALNDPQLRLMSNREIARTCRLDPKFVAAQQERLGLTGEADRPRYVKGADGKMYPAQAPAPQEGRPCTQVGTSPPDTPDGPGRDQDGPGHQVGTSPPGAPAAPAAGLSAVGKSIVNGVLMDDPPNIAEKRREGKIPAGVVPEITIPDRGEGADEVPTPGPEPTFEEWFATLPLAGQLDGDRLKTFEKDAHLYWLMRGARKQYEARYQEAKKEAACGRRGAMEGEYEYRTRCWLRLNDPANWVRCPRTEEGGCGGLGELPLFGECKKCRRRGYLLFERR
jgi:hypothetical protein